MKTVCKWIATTAGIFGFLLILGTAGASDAGSIGGGEVATRCLWGLGMMLAGVGINYIINEKENA